jgi:hypothetical protein
MIVGAMARVVRGTSFSREYGSIPVMCGARNE